MLEEIAPLNPFPEESLGELLSKYVAYAPSALL